MLTALALVLLARNPSDLSPSRFPPGNFPQGSPPKGGARKEAPPKEQAKSDATRKPVAVAPTVPPATVADVLAWDGWKGVGVSPAAVLSWPSYPKAIPAPRPDDATATVFKLKVFVLTRAELDPLGVERASLLPSMVDRARTALRNVQAIVRDASGGRIDVSLALAQEEEILDLSSGEAAVADYVRTRINGGLFDAEDGVDRGPYSGVLVIEPGGPQVATVVAGTPIRTFDFYTADGQVEGDALEAHLLETILAMMGDRLRERGGVVLAPDAPLAPGTPISEGWPDLRSVPAAVLPSLRPGLEASGGASAGGVAWRIPLVGHGMAPSTTYGPVSIYFEPDPERGAVLRYREASEVRLGGFRLPIDTFPVGKNLAFWTRVSAREGLSLRAAVGKTPEGVPRTGAIRTEETIMGPLEAERGAALPLDGAWHRIVVAIPPGTSELTVGPSLVRMGLSRRDSALVNVWFDDFEWTDEVPTPIVDGPSRAAAERLGSATPADLSALLADPSGRVRARALTLVPAGAADLEPLVLARAAEIDPAVAREAVKALTRIGTPSALLAVRRILTVGPNEAARQQAALELGRTADPAVIPIVSILLGRQSWRSRLTAVEALTPFKQENAIRFRLSATLQDVPELRLAALRPATTANADERQKLLYAAINDPSDEIRAFASDRLLDSPNESDVAEGGRAAADDSAWVRVLFQRALARRANPAFRPLILKGTTDAVGLVRAESLRALAVLGPVSAAEAGNLLGDSNPEVLMALIEVQRAGKIELPETTRGLIAASKDARVVASRG